MIISLIAALSENRVIGKNNDLPWHLPDDMKYFMETTKGHHAIMGRKNYDSIPQKFKPLPNRTNIVITRQQEFKAPGCLVVNSLAEAIEIATRNEEQEAFVIGGSEIYKLSMPYANRLYLTEIHSIIEGDTFFPEINKTEWIETSRRYHPPDDKHEYGFDFVIYDNVTS